MKTVSKKVVLLGNEGVGKTSLVKRYVHSIFNDEYLTTIGIKISKKVVRVGDTDVSLMLWDIAGDMMSKSLYNNYLKGAHGILLVCDAMRLETYDSIISERNKNLTENFTETAISIIVNKSDLISEDSENNPLANWEYDFLTSAKNGENVEAAFQKIAEKIIG